MFGEHLCSHTLSEFFLPQYHLCSFNNPDLELRILELKILILRETFKTEAPFVRHNFLGVVFTHCLLLPKGFGFFVHIPEDDNSLGRDALCFLLPAYGHC